MDKVITSIHSDQERAQVARASAPAADHYLLPAPAFGLEPGIGASGLIEGRGAFRDDAFEVEPTGRLQDCVTWLCQMLHILDQLLGPAALIQQLLQPCLAVREWKTTQVLALHKQEIESEVGQFFGASVGQCGLQGGEIRRAVVIECDDFAVDDAVIQTARSLSDGGKIRRPV